MCAYIGHFFCIVIAINLYSDGDRYLRCGSNMNDLTKDPTQVYDMALYLFAIYYIIEWVRFIMLLVVSFIGVNLMWIWYLPGALNVPFGLAVFIYGYAARFSDDGKACADVQIFRARYLTA